MGRGPVYPPIPSATATIGAPAFTPPGQVLGCSVTVNTSLQVVVNKCPKNPNIGRALVSCQGALKPDLNVNDTFATPTALRSTEIGGELFLDIFDGGYAEAVAICIAKPFEARYGVKVHVGTFASGDEQLARVQAGNDRIDVTLFDASLIYAAATVDAILPLTLENIPNIANQHDRFRNSAYGIGDGNRYGAALVWGETGIGYSPRHLKEEPISWEDFFRPEHIGRVAMNGAPNNMVLTAALMTGQDINHIVDLSAIEMTLLELKTQLRMYWASASEAERLFATGEIVMGNFYRDRAIRLTARGCPVMYVIPGEGAPGWVDCLAIPRTCRNRRAAEAFINFALDASIMKGFVTQGIAYAPSTTIVGLCDEQEERLGATPGTLGATKFANPAYVASNREIWYALADAVKAS